MLQRVVCEPPSPLDIAAQIHRARPVYGSSSSLPYPPARWLEAFEALILQYSALGW